MDSNQTAAIKAPKYLVCVDGREESKVALRLACMKAKAKSSTVSILHVIAPADFQTLGAIADRMREERRKEAEQLLSALVDETVAAFGITPTPLLREGPTGDEIIAAALEDHTIMMVVIGTAQQAHGRGTLATWLAGQLGSKLSIPLLMVPGNLTDQQLQNLI